MNIEGSKLVSVLQAGTPAEGRGQSLVEDGASPGGFADALMGQMGALGAVKARAEAPAQYEALSASPPMPPLAGQAEFPAPLSEQPSSMAAAHVSETGKLAGTAFEGKGEETQEAGAAAAAPMPLFQHPQPEKVAGSPAHGINEEKSGESHPGIASPEPLTLRPRPQQSGQAKAGEAAHSESSEGAEALSDRQTHSADLAGEPRQKSGDAVAARAHAVSDGRRDGHPGSDNATENPNPALSVMNPWPPALPATGETIDTVQEEKAGVPHSANETGRKNAPQSFIQPLFEEFKSNATGTTDGARDELGKNLAFGQIIKEHQDLNENRSEKSLLSGSTEPVAAKSPAADGNTPLPPEFADIPLVKGQPVDNRAEMPAMSKPLAHPGWNEELGERIVWMSAKDLSAAEIKLNPQHLGPISVRIEINNDQATIAFTAQHAAVRDALEASLPKLREMMSDQQINLANVDISQNPSSDQQHQSSSRQAPRHFEDYTRRAGSEFEAGEEAENKNITDGKGIVNLYA
jgi:flagellar hook-length control protein FliK